MKKLVNGVLVDMTAKEIAEREAEEALETSKDRRPLAMGTDLIKFINLTTETSLDDDQAFMIVSKLKDFMIYCQQGRCNPFTKQTLDNTLKTLDKAFANGQKELIVGLVNKWAETVRFEEK